MRKQRGQKVSYEHMKLGVPFYDAYQGEGETNGDRIRLMKQVLLKAMDSSLTQRQRETVSLYFFRNMTVTQIAREQGVSPSVVCRHIQRGKQRLERVLACSLVFLDLSRSHPEDSRPVY